jgi:RNA polymerase sigma factor (sigma-70 family)
MASDLHSTIDTLWRMEQGKLIASVTRMVRDVGLAEELAQDALVTALQQWPKTGVPDKPAAWLMTAAKNRAIDHIRRNKIAQRKYEEIGRDLEIDQGRTVPDLDEALDDDVGDELLRLIFISCHPVLSMEARVAMTLRMVGGLTTEEIARAFLVPEPTVAQRIVRAKRTLSDSKVPFELPRGADREARVTSVLQVLYLIFNEGYAATGGENWLRPQLCQEAMRLGRVLAGLAPDEAEVHGLVALMEIQASRFAARTDGNGEPVLLMDQNRARWDRLLNRRGLAALERAETLADPRGSYAMQAAIAACHARARTADETDWKAIAALYAELAERTPSPVIELNRAVALAMAFGPAEGLALADTLVGEPSLKAYHLLPSVRADFLQKLGRLDEARAEYERAAALTRNARERDLLLGRAASCR